MLRRFATESTVGLTIGVMLAVVLALPFSSQAQITFTKVADTSTQVPDESVGTTFEQLISSTWGPPSIDNRHVTFAGTSRNGNQIGIYKLLPEESLTKVANRSTPVPGVAGPVNFRDFLNPSIDAAGNVTFWGQRFGDPRGIFTAVGSSINVVADRDTPLPGREEQPFNFEGPTNDDGNVAFASSDIQGNTGVYTNVRGGLNLVADTNTSVPSGTGNFSVVGFLQISHGYPSISGENVAFLGADSLNKQGLYTSVGGVLNVVADTNTQIPGQPEGTNFLRIGAFSFDGDNLGFVGASNNNLSPSGAYTDIGGMLNVVVDSSILVPGRVGGFTRVDSISFDNGNMAFAGGGSGILGIYTNITGPVTKVIDHNDTLDGKSINSNFPFILGKEGLSGNQIVFGVGFSDGSQGIYVANLDGDGPPPPPPPPPKSRLLTPLVDLDFEDAQLPSIHGWQKKSNDEGAHTIVSGDAGAGGSNVLRMEGPNSFGWWLDVNNLISLDQDWVFSADMRRVEGGGAFTDQGIFRVGEGNGGSGFARILNSPRGNWINIRLEMDHEFNVISTFVDGELFETHLPVDELNQFVDSTNGILFGFGNETISAIAEYDNIFFALAQTDSDEDGLADEDEATFGTNPNDPDTDDDGLLDGTEVDIAAGSGCPDPLDSDSDNDTLLDGSEVTNGTNPCAADTDGDGLPDNTDPTPTEPGAPPSFLQQEALDLADNIRSLNLSGFNGPNDNANTGRRNALANRAMDAAGLIAVGDIQGAIEALTSLLEKIDGQTPPPDWMDNPPDSLVADVEQLISLLQFEL